MTSCYGLVFSRIGFGLETLLLAHKTYKLIKCCVCLSVWMLSRNRCTYGLVILRADLLMNPDRTPKPGRFDLLYQIFRSS